MSNDRIDSANAVRLWSVPDTADAEPPELAVPELAPPTDADVQPKLSSTSLPSRNPLDAAFRAPKFSTLVTATLNEATEQEVLRQRGPSLVAYGRFDPRARPVVLVHGIMGSGEEMSTWADRLTAEGRQVYVFQYDDRGDYTTVSGQHLARELRGLWARTQHRDQPLDIVAHSMGGLVSRVALNTLAESGVERAGFPSVRVQALDTPLAGYPHEAPMMRWSNFATRGVMAMVNMSGLYDMRGSSAMFEGLYATELRNVTFSNTAARGPATGLFTAVNMNHLGPTDRAAIADYFTHGTLPELPQLRNYVRGLEHDVAGPALREALNRELETHPPAEAMRLAFDAVMPQVRASHDSIVTNPDPSAMEHIVRSIAGEPAGDAGGDGLAVPRTRAEILALFRDE